jgi:hypothetical protein
VAQVYPFDGTIYAFDDVIYPLYGPVHPGDDLGGVAMPEPDQGGHGRGQEGRRDEHLPISALTWVCR